MIWLLACVAHRPLTGQSFEQVPNYPALVDSWTREDRRYDGLETVLLTRATWDSPAFVAAREHQRAFLMALPAEVVDEQTASEQSDAQVNWRFTLIVTSDKKSRPPLTNTQPPWKVRLLVGGAECTPKSLKERSPDSMDRALYPWLNPWNNVWEAVFAKDCGEGTPVLQVLGPAAAAELRW